MDCPHMNALMRKDRWYMMNNPVRSDRWVLLCLHLAMHFSTLFAKSRAFGLFLQWSQMSLCHWTAHVVTIHWNLWTSDLPGPWQWIVVLTDTWQETISNQESCQNMKWKYFCYISTSWESAASWEALTEYRTTPPISFCYSSYLVLRKLPYISPACNLDLYWVVCVIFSHSRNA